MTTPPKVVKLEALKIKKPPWRKSPVRDAEGVIKSSAQEKKKDEPTTEDKKAERKNGEKKSPVGKKVKIRKRKQREKIANLSDQLRESRKIAEVLKQKPEGQREHVDLDHFEEKRSGRRLQTQRRGDFQNEDKGLFSERSSWVSSSPSTRL